MLPTMRLHNQKWLPGLFNDFFENDIMDSRINSTAPAINVIENENEYRLEVAAPGMTKEDFSVRLNEEGDLIINMEKKSEKNEKDEENGHYLRREFSHTKFQQTMLLPENAEHDKINAKVENGVLFVNIPKKKNEKESYSKAIEIK